MGREIKRLNSWNFSKVPKFRKSSKPHNHAGFYGSRNLGVNAQFLELFKKFQSSRKVPNRITKRVCGQSKKFQKSSFARARFFYGKNIPYRVYIFSNRKKVIYSNTINYFILYAKIYVCEKLRRFAPTPCRGACCNFSANIFLRMWEMIAICFIAPKNPFDYARGINYAHNALKTIVGAIARVCGALKLDNKTAARNLFFQSRQSWGRRGAAFSCATKNF